MSRIFFDVDTQNDFMKKDGALYVPNAEELIPAVRELTSLALKHKIQILGSVDHHYGTEAWKPVEGELSKWGGPFPDHCMADTDGAKMVNQKLLPGTTVLAGNWLPDGTPKYPKAVLSPNGDPVFFEKQTYDVFTHPCLPVTLQFMNVTEAYVYGVATDYCVQAAVLGLRKMAIDVYVIEDAIAGVAPATTYAAVQKMSLAGAQFRMKSDVVRIMDAIYG